MGETCYARFTDEQVKGKVSLCPICGEGTFLMDREAMRRRAPRCLNCQTTKKATDIRKLKTVANDILTDMLLSKDEETIEEEPFL